MLGLTGLASIVNVTVPVIVLLEVVAVIEVVKVPAFVGFPEINPVLAVSFKPAGRELFLSIAHVADSPPESERVSLKL